MVHENPKRILITGATSGIGWAAARLFSRQGWEVGVLAEVPALVEERVQALLEAGGKAFAVHADLSRPGEAEGLIARVEAERGPVDVLVNNAGIGLQGDIADASMADVRLLFEVNFFAAAALSREAMRSMAGRGGGRIINVSSASARRALPGLGVYASTKAAMHALSQALRVEGRTADVYVTEILPMSVRTPFFERAKNIAAREYEVGAFSTTPEAVAGKILRAVRRPVPEVYTSTLSRFVLSLDSFYPKLLDAILIHRRRRGL
jgi:short-subunit dehydrogenase